MSGSCSFYCACLVKDNRPVVPWMLDDARVNGTSLYGPYFVHLDHSWPVCVGEMRK